MARFSTATPVNYGQNPGPTLLTNFFLKNLIVSYKNPLFKMNRNLSNKHPFKNWLYQIEQKKETKLNGSKMIN